MQIHTIIDTHLYLQIFAPTYLYVVIEKAEK